MKAVVFLGDGMADRPVDELAGMTPLEKASTPHMDLLAQNGLFGLARTVPEGMPPGSDTANLSEKVVHRPLAARGGQHGH